MQAQNTPLARVRVLQRSLYRAAKANPTRKFGVLYDKLCRADVLQMAYARVNANHGAAGIDQQTFEVIEKEIGTDTFLRSIQEQLSRRRYKAPAGSASLYPEGGRLGAPARHPCHHRSCSAGSGEDRHRTVVRGGL